MGDGVFLEEAADRLSFFGLQGDLSRSLVGVEIDRQTALRTSQRLLRKYGVTPKIMAQGFFKTLENLRPEIFDVVVGNPPFARYRDFLPKEERKLAFQFLEDSGFKSTRLMNAWVPFLVAAIRLLKKGGRLAMVMPAELLQVSYAAPIREYLHTRFGFIFVVTFSKLVFRSVEQEVVLLMGTKGEGKGLRLVEYQDESDLELVYKFRGPQAPVEDSREKWTQYFLNDDQRKALRIAIKHPAVARLGTLASVDVGVVTGCNDFFIVTEQRAKELNADKHLLPVVARTAQLRGINFTKTDWNETHPSYLLAINPTCKISRNLSQYLKQGKKTRVDRGFKCKIRKQWYVVPSVWIPDAFMFRQIGVFPRIVRSTTKATCTDTLHRLKFRDKMKSRTIVGSFYNSLTMVCAEIYGRSYGGGVLELMPTEAEKLPVPLTDLPSKFFDEMDSLLRNGSLDEALELGDNEILHEKCGMSSKAILTIRRAWLELSDRRRTRKRADNVFNDTLHNEESSKT